MLLLMTRENWITLVKKCPAFVGLLQFQVVGKTLPTINTVLAFSDSAMCKYHLRTMLFSDSNARLL